MPSDMWTALNQHLSLAQATESAVLQVMIADKISFALNRIIKMITDFVQGLKVTTTKDPELKEIELKLVAALANDCAMHIEEVCRCVNLFVYVCGCVCRLPSV